MRGFTMIELLVALTLAGLMVAGVATMINSTLEDTRAQQAALYQSQLTAAATRLVEQNYTALASQASTSAPVVVKLSGTPYQLSSYLSSAMNGANAYGQTPCLLIYGTATAGALQALLVTEGGRTISDTELGYIAANAGAGGGSIQATNNANGAANGAFGSWSVAAPNPAGASCTGTKTGVGHLASLIYYNGTQAQNADYLYRVAVPGDPQANMMQVPIVLAQLTVPDYTACTQLGSIAADSAGNVVNCDGQVWTPQASFHWREPVADEAALSSVSSPMPGDVRMTQATNRAYTYNGSTLKWQALAVDEAGNLALGNAQTKGTPCPAMSASETLVSTDATGHVLTCVNNGIWQEQSAINPLTVATDSDCAINVGQSGASTNFSCNTTATSPSYNGTMGYWQSVVTRTVPVMPADGAISVYAWAHLQDAYVTSCPGATQDLSNGQGAYVTLFAELVDNDNQNTIASAVNQSSKIVGDLANVNLNLTHALPKNGNGYFVRFTTFWNIFGGADPATFQPSYCGPANNIFLTPGVVTSWTITPFY